MNNQELILEKLGYNKLFKDEIKDIWKQLLKYGHDSKDIKVVPSFTVTTADGYPDLPSVPTSYTYKWDLKTCGTVKKIKDFLIFGVDINKVDIEYSEPIVKQQLMTALKDRYDFFNVGDLSEYNYASFYNFCKNELQKDDSDPVYRSDVDEFFESDIFNQGLVRECQDFVEMAWDKNKPLKGGVEAVGEDILPLVYYSIPKRTCYYILRSSSAYIFNSDIRLDYRVLSGKLFRIRDLDNFMSHKILAGLPRHCISNASYKFK